MAITFENNTKEQISFDEFVLKVTNTIKKNDVASLVDCVELLQMLSNNETFLIDYLNAGLKNYETFQEENKYNSDIFILHRHPLFFIRCVVWNGTTLDADPLNKHEDIYHTLRAHDHNFSFLTVGYLNDGYLTDIWEYDNEAITGYIGEKVDLHFLERTDLPKGKTMLYRASKDIHAQHPPKQQSVSLNIMFNDIHSLTKEQYYFDVERGVIDSHVSVSSSGRHLILELAKLFGNNQTFDLVDNIAKKHPSPYVRSKAYDSLSQILNDNHVWQQALKDPDKIVKSYAKRALNLIE
jgi:hypothetical protein